MKRRIDQLRSWWWEWSDATPNPRQRLPTVLQFPVNDICNSKCQMCHIWKRKLDHEVTPAELSAMLENPLFREVRKVGINGGEPTLRRDLPDLVQVILNKLPHLQGISLITNAIQERNVLRMIDELTRRCTGAGIRMNVMVSVDGVGEVHDRVRGVPGNFASADRVLDHLLESSLNRSILIGCTLIRENVFDAENVLIYARTKPVYARFRVGVPHRRLYTRDLAEPFAFDESERYHLACFLDELRMNYEMDSPRRAFYLSLRNQIIQGDPRSAGCAWKNHGITLTARGELAYCAVESPVLGSLLTERADDLYWRRADVLRDIKETRCSTCLHDYDGLQDRRILLEGAVKRRLPQLPGGSAALRLIRSANAEWRDRLADRRARNISSHAGRNGVAHGEAVLLCGWYGTETLGDKGILSGLVTSLRAAGWEGAIDLASLEPYVSRQTCREMPELGLRTVVTPAIARQVVARGEYRLVAIAGGPLMSPISAVYELLGIFTDAAALNIRRAILGCGIGPLGYSERRDAAIARLLMLSQQTVLRDRASLDLARAQLGFTGSASIAPDPAFIWTKRQIDTAKPVMRNGPVLLALRDWPIHEYGRGLSNEAALELKSRFEKELIEMVDELRRLVPDWTLLPMAMHTHARGGDDRMFFQRLFASHPLRSQRLSWKRVSPAEAFTAFRSARGVVAMRFHSAVLAIAASTPYVAIDYTRGGKMAALLPAVGNPDTPWTIEGFSGRECAAKLIEITDRPPVPPPTGVEEAYTTAWRQVLAHPN